MSSHISFCSNFTTHSIGDPLSMNILSLSIWLLFRFPTKMSFFLKKRSNQLFHEKHINFSSTSLIISESVTFFLEWPVIDLVRRYRAPFYLSISLPKPSAPPPLTYPPQRPFFHLHTRVPREFEMLLQTSAVDFDTILFATQTWDPGFRFARIFLMTLSVKFIRFHCCVSPYRQLRRKMFYVSMRKNVLTNITLC